MNSWTTASYAPAHPPVDPATWPPNTGELWRCETCQHCTREKGPPVSNSAHCAELRRLKLDDGITIPALCWTEAMAACLPYAEDADLIVALPGWRESRGARLEERHRRGEFVEYVELFR